MTVPRVLVVGLVGLLLMACATPVPRSGDYQRSVPPDYLGLMVDSDLLNTSRLDHEDRNTAQELLKIYYGAEYGLSTYIVALEVSLGENEQLTKDYSTADALVGAAAGLSSIGVIFATAAVAAPVTGVVWIGISQYVQHYRIDPQIRKAERQLDEARSLLRLFPDIEKLFDGLVFSETYEEAHRRFKKWEVYVKNLEARTKQFFAKTADGRQPGSGPSVPVPPSPENPADKSRP